MKKLESVKNLKFKYKKAFTLAEVLITLTIVGIIASLTIPSLVNNINNTTNVVQLKKFYSDIQQAFMLLQADNGGSIVPVFSTNPDGGANAMNAFLTKLNYVKNCGSAMGCWYNTPLYLLNGSINNSTYDTSQSGFNAKAILANGTMMTLYIHSSNCTTNAGSGPLNNSACAQLYVDLNGANGPNKIGRDYFKFWITQTGIYPIGMLNDGASCNISPGDLSSSHGCAAKVLTEGAMNY